MRIWGKEGIESRGIQLKVDIIAGKDFVCAVKGKRIRNEQERRHRGLGRLWKTH